MEKVAGKQTFKKFIMFFRNRGVTVLLLLLLLVLLLETTTAKYQKNINEYSSVAASSFHFSSNYLSEEGNSYNIRGWNGDTYTINLQIRNFDNDLLYNEDGQDVLYMYDINKTENADRFEVAVQSVTAQDGKTVDPLVEEETNWYELKGGQKSYHYIRLEVKGSEELEKGDKIAFEIKVKDHRSRQFYKEMSAKMSFTVAESVEFISHRELNTSPNSNLVKYTVMTTELTGSEGSIGSKRIQIKWDPKKVTINELNKTVFNIIFSDSKEDYNPTEGYIIIPMRAYSTVNLEFFKVNADDTITEDHITSTVMNTDTPIPAE